MQKLSIQSWAIVALTVVVIAFILYFFLHKKPDVKQEVTKYEVELLKKEIETLNTKYKADSAANVQREAAIVQRYDGVITRINKNVNILYKQLHADIDTVRGLNNDESFVFFSNWVPKEN